MKSVPMMVDNCLFTVSGRMTVAGTECPGSASIQKVELFADSNGLYVPAGHGVSDVEPGEST